MSRAKLRHSLHAGGGALVGILLAAPIIDGGLVSVAVIFGVLIGGGTWVLYNAAALVQAARLGRDTDGVDELVARTRRRAGENVRAGAIIVERNDGRLYEAREVTPGHLEAIRAIREGER